MDFLRTLQEGTPLFLAGLKLTVSISVLAILIGMLIGFITCLCRISNNIILKAVSGIYVWIIRGTPMIVQAFIVYFGMPQLIQTFVPGFKIDSYTAGLITLSLNAGAYLSEVFRGGLMAIPKGQSEAARSLGLSKAKTMLKVVLPQAIKISIPSMVNQFIITIKDSSILSVIGLADLVNRAKVYVGSSYQFFATYTVVAVYYLVIISILMIISMYLEKRLSYEYKG
ncbi:MAG: amino acid ABC transporter permease [Clostridiales bacterium]|nr:amino acid ABC transporter permease [Clostridiales bacterium]